MGDTLCAKFVKMALSWPSFWLFWLVGGGGVSNIMVVVVIVTGDDGGSDG